VEQHASKPDDPDPEKHAVWMQVNVLTQLREK